MKKFEINKKQVTQQAFVAPKAYKRALELINEFNGTITSEDKKPIVALFKSKAQAQKFLDQFESEYTVAHEAYAMSKHKYPSPMEMYTWEALAEYAEEDEPKQAEPKKAPSSPKKSKGNGKMTLNDFVVSKPNCTREEAKAYGFKGTREDLRVLKRTLGVR